MITRTFLTRLAVLGGLAVSSPVFAQYSTPMRDVDNGARQPVNYSVQVFVLAGSGIGTNSTTVTVPNGKRLVIETISFIGLVPNTETGYLMITVTAGAGTPSGATTTDHFIPMVKFYSQPGFADTIGGIGAFRMYADSGNTVSVSYSRGSTAGSDNVQVGITGYLVNLP
jgi:hypothetical protein